MRCVVIEVILTAEPAKTQYRDYLSHLSPYDPTAAARIDMLQQAATQRGGLSPAGAEIAALKALEGTLTAQSYHLAYMDAFMLIAFLFTICLPLLLLIRIQKNEPADLSSAH